MPSTDEIVFRPRRGRIVPLVFGVLFLVLCAVIGAALVASHDWTSGDAAILLAFGVLVAGLMLRYAAIRAIAAPDGLHLRNLFTSRTLPWDEIVAVHFPDGEPWVSVELVDTEMIAVMAIQRGDGPVSREQAQRLADYWGDHRP